MMHDEHQEKLHHEQQAAVLSGLGFLGGSFMGDLASKVSSEEGLDIQRDDKRLVLWQKSGLVSREVATEEWQK